MNNYSKSLLLESMVGEIASVSRSLNEIRRTLRSVDGTDARQLEYRAIEGLNALMKLYGSVGELRADDGYGDDEPGPDESGMFAVIQ